MGPGRAQCSRGSKQEHQVPAVRGSPPRGLAPGGQSPSHPSTRPAEDGPLPLRLPAAPSLSGGLCANPPPVGAARKPRAAERPATPPGGRTRGRPAGRQPALSVSGATAPHPWLDGTQPRATRRARGTHNHARGTHSHARGTQAAQGCRTLGALWAAGSALLCRWRPAGPSPLFVPSGLSAPPSPSQLTSSVCCLLFPVTCSALDISPGVGAGSSRNCAPE